MTTSEVYWLTRLDGIHDFLTTVCITLLIIAPCVLFFIWMMVDVKREGAEKDGSVKSFKRLSAWSIGACLGCGLLSCFVPTTKELIAIYGISYLTQNKDAREIPAEALKVLNQKLKEMESE
jgi:uncharacterized membrane protein